MRLRLGGARGGGWLAAAALVVLGTVTGPAAGTTVAQPAPGENPARAIASSAFSATVAAQGARILVTVPGGPFTDTPVDAGGPTAQATLDSLGTSQGFAAFPDPGGLVLSLPGLAAGLLASGVSGLPPIKLPTLPPYPLYVSSDAAITPKASVGAGPYQLGAQSDDRSSRASATAGLRNSAFGSVSSLHSEASVSTEVDGAVTAEAVAEIQGLTIGPLSVGSVRSTATMARSSDGTVTPSSSLDVDLLRVGGVGVSLKPGGLEVFGLPVPLPVDAALQGLLKAAGITIEVMPTQTLEDGISSAALRITTPLTLSGIGTGPGVVSISLGSVSARLSGAADETPPDVDLGSSDLEPGLDAGFDGGLPSTLDFGVDGGAVVDSPLTSPGAESPASAAPGAEPPIPLAESRLAFDVRSLYLMVMLLGCGVLVTSQLIRLLGVRAPWTSSAG